MPVLKSFPLLQTLFQRVMSPGEAPLMIMADATIADATIVDEPAIDIWSYAEPAGEESNPLNRNVLQWRRLISSVRDPVVEFSGQPVDVIGFVYRPASNDVQQFILARRVIRCCLADTMPLGLTIYSEDSEGFETGQWLRIKGQFEGMAMGNSTRLVVVPWKIEAIVEPKKAYINGVF